MIKAILMYYFLLPTTDRVIEECEKQNVLFPRIVASQYILETGHGESYNCKVRNNLFGLVNSSEKCYYSFFSWRQSVTAYKNKVQYKYKGGNYYKFLKDIGYAADKDYENKLKIIYKSIVD